MAYRNIFVANKSKIKLSNNQIIVNNGEEFSFPIEDIRSILIDDCFSTLSGRLISSLADNAVCLIICDEKHMPSAQLLPIGSYCRLNKRLTLQVSQSQPKQKRIWQEIIKVKISNQSKCLEVNQIDNYKSLLNISKTVLSGDTNNREGYAARLYFKSLFGNNFNRDKENIINASLNYGYSILRSYISKTIVAYGLEPSIGIHHKNQLNQFNLADDIIEPFRPIVDNYVFKNYMNWNENLSTGNKAELLLLLNCAVLVDKKRHSVANAVDLIVQSLISVYEDNAKELKLPEFLDVSYFNYD